MNRRGQALVEFILILPIFLMILFAIVDFGILLQRKSNLENKSTDIVRMIRNGDTVEEVTSQYKNLEVKLSPKNEKYLSVTILDEVSLISPVLDKVLGNPYEIRVERVIPNVE